MAVLNSFPTVAVTITSNGEELKEYDDVPKPGPKSDPKILTKYIECRDNAPFEFNLVDYGEDADRCTCFVIDIEIEGVSVVSRFLQDRDITKFPEFWSWDRTIFEENGTTCEKPFEFSKLSIIPIDILSDQERTQKELFELEGKGELTVEIWRMGKRKTVKRVEAGKKKRQEEWLEEEDRGRKTVEKTKEELMVLTEKATIRNGISHLAGFGPTERVDYEPIEFAEPFELGLKYLDKRPIATYIFKYRSEASLRSMQIIRSGPRSDSQSELHTSSPAANTGSIISNTQPTSLVIDLTDTEIPSLAAPNITRSTSRTRSDTVVSNPMIKNLSSEEMILLALHDFEIEDISGDQLEKLAKKSLNTLPVKKIHQIIGSAPGSGPTSLDDLSITEMRLLATYELDIRQLPWAEIKRLVALKLDTMTTEEVTTAIRSRRVLKREIKEEDIRESTAKRAKTIDLYD